jgi:hypothetical protein
MASQLDISKLNLVEIGTFYGDSTIVFAQYFRQVITIDPFVSGLGDISNSVDMVELYHETKERLSHFKNIQIIRDYSHNACKSFMNYIDVLYIDGKHDYDSVKRDINDYFKKVVYFLCGHDYRAKFPGVVKAVNEFRKPDKTFRDSSFLIKL